jgi:starch synthase
MRIAMVASECEPFAKTGGLADVVDALARALGAAGHPVDVYLPRYRGVEPPAGASAARLLLPAASPTVRGREGSGKARTEVTLWTGQANGYRIRMVDHPPSFERDGLYGAGGSDYPDNAARFTLLGRAALETLRAEGGVDVLHGHDWQAGPAILALHAREGDDAVLGRVATVMTCHNLAYHGWTPREVAWQLDLPPTVGAPDGVDLLRESVAVADMVNTVSPTFARESLTPEFGAGLDDVLRARGDRYVGILNGIDTTLWDPARDPDIARPYSPADRSGKADCRAALCAELGLDPGGPVFGVVGRLDPQKGFDLVTGAAPGLLAAGGRLAVLGTGDRRLIEGLLEIDAAHPDRVAVIDRFDRGVARRIYAGADLFLMPSRFEPSGQGQLIALRYGTPPLVRHTGGLADTVTDADADPGEGNGFSFRPASVDALLEAAMRGMRALDDPARWEAIQGRGMAADVSWARPAARYVEVYQRAVQLLGGPGRGPALPPAA